MSMQIKFDNDYKTSKTITGIAGDNYRFYVTVHYDSSINKITVDDIQWEVLAIVDIVNTEWKHKAEKRIKEVVKKGYEL